MDTGRKHTHEELTEFMSKLYDALNDGQTDADLLAGMRERLKARGVDVDATVTKAKAMIRERTTEGGTR